MPQAILDWGIRFILAFQGATDLSGFMNAVTFIGSEEFFLIFFPLLYWAVDNKLRLQVAIFFAISVLVNSTAKIAIHEPRPYWLDPGVQPLADPDGLFGNPSGHAQHTLVIWSTVAAHYGRRWLWAAVGLLILLVGLSRVYLGMHFPSDVLVGWLIGIVLLWAMFRWQAPVLAWLLQKPWQRQVRWVLLLSLAGILIGIFVSIITKAVVTVPQEWLDLAAAKTPEVEILPFTFTDIITIGAIMFGMAGGYIWLEQRGGFYAGGPLWQRLVRYLLGAVIVVIIWAGLDAVFSAIAGDETLLGYILRYIRYATVGLWVSALGPLLFMRLGLARSAGAA